MAKDTGQFTIELTPGELLWLGRALGKLRLSLPGDPYRHLLQAEAEAQVRQGGESLAKRGLIRPTGGPAWEVDRFAAILFEWLSEAESFTLAEVLPRGKEPRQAGVYFLQGKGLLVRYEAGTYHLHLFESDDDLRRGFLDFLGLPSRPSPDPLPALRFPQPAQLMPLIWRDPDAALRALENSGLSRSKAKSTLARLQSWDFLVSLTSYRPVDESLQPVSLQFLGGNESRLWGSKVESKEVELFEFELVGNITTLKFF